MTKWLDDAVPVNYYKKLPVSYFSQFEMHLGGCGGYIVSGYKTLSDVDGASLGMRFGK